MSVGESHIRVVLKDNTILDFNRKCTNVDYKSDKLCAFTNENSKAYALLALITYENISYIENYPYKEVASHE